MATTFKTTTNVTFTSIATILIPIGVTLLATNIVSGLVVVGLGIVALIAREYFKSV
jgi:hypothetical protein